MRDTSGRGLPAVVTGFASGMALPHPSADKAPCSAVPSGPATRWFRAWFSRSVVHRPPWRTSGVAPVALRSTASTVSTGGYRPLRLGTGARLRGTGGSTGRPRAAVPSPHAGTGRQWMPDGLIRTLDEYSFGRIMFGPRWGLLSAWVRRGVCGAPAPAPRPPRPRRSAALRITRRPRRRPCPPPGRRGARSSSGRCPACRTSARTWSGRRRRSGGRSWRSLDRRRWSRRQGRRAPG